jgi:hypothetical protein
MAKNEWTTLRVKTQTKKKLAKLGTTDESYNAVLERVIAGFK